MSAHFRLAAFLLTCFFAHTLPAQEYLQWIRQAEEGAPLSEIQQIAEEYYLDRDQGRGSGYKQFKRWEYLIQDRLDETGRPLNYSRMSWEAARELAPLFKKSETESEEGCQADWNILAPIDGYTVAPGGYNPGIGRVNVVAFHPNDPNLIYAGTPAGGIWRTTNQGVSWTPLTDHLPSLGVSGIVIHPQNPNLIYILTGDGDGAQTYSIGVLKSTDGGDNWEETGLSFGVSQLIRGYKLIMQPGNPNLLMAVASTGIYRSIDAGQTWNLAQTGYFMDIEFHPANPSIAYASTKTGVFRSENAGQNWSAIGGMPSGTNRIALAVSPANPDYVYAFAGPADGDGAFKGIFRSENGGLSFSPRAFSPNVLGYSTEGADDRSQSAFDLALAVSPGNAETVILGGINVWRSETGGQTLDISSHWYYPTLAANGLQYTHADIHELVYNPLDGALWCGSDGGIYVSFDHGKTWEDRSSLGAQGLSITQFYRIADFAASPDIIIGGTQDNGSNRWDGGVNIRHFDGADGMDCMIHPADDQIQYHTRQNGALRKSFDGGESHSSIRPGSTSGNWVTPLAMHPTDPEIIYAAYEDTVYVSANGGLDWGGSVPQLGVGKYRSLHVAPANPQTIYVATDLRMFVTQNGGADWTEITSGLSVTSFSRITRIATNAANENEVWVTFSGYAPTHKVYFSENAGASWQNRSDGLPNLPVQCIVADPAHSGAFYIGMDVGVYYRDTSLSKWAPFFTGLPNAPVFDLKIHAATGMLRAGTFGRGIWETPLYQPDQTAPTIACPDPQTVSLDANCAFQLPDFSALATVSDNCDPSPAMTQSPAPGTAIGETTLITLVAADWEGNAAECQFEVTPQDTAPPTLLCPDDIEVYSLADTIVDYLVSWSDNCSEAQGALIEGLPGGAVFPLGLTTVSWMASDSLGNETMCTFTVTVNTPSSAQEATLSGYDFTLFPNPAREEIHVSLEAFAGRPATLRVLSPLGQTLREIPIGAVQSNLEVIDLRGLGAGMYYLEVQSGEIRLVKKFAIK